MKRLLISIIFLFLNPRLYANDLPKEIYGSYQFHSTAGRNVIGILTILILIYLAFLKKI